MRAFVCCLLFANICYGGYKQIGDIYSRPKALEAYYKVDENIKKLIANSVLINSKRRTGLNRGTGFYLGQHKGKHLVITNSHVMQKDECEGARVTFLTPKLGRTTVYCEKILLNLYKKQKSDLTLFSVKLKAKRILGKGLKIDFDYSPIAGEEVALTGFGLKRAPSRNINLKLRRFKPLLSMDDDCVIASPNGISVYFGGSAVDHTIALGCDVATGDSGAAVINRNSGEVVGLLWGMGADAKSNQHNSQYLRENVFGYFHSMMWRNMSYAILLKKLRAKLSEHLEI